MEDFELKEEDLIRLRDDLEDGKEYGLEYYIKDMNFKGFRKIKKPSYNGRTATIYNNDFPYHYTKEMIAEVKRPKYETIYKREEPILDDKEKEYLGNVIRPFRDKIGYIIKYETCKGEYICIRLKNDEPILLPDFKENTMYKNMKVDKEYTLEELGL